MPVGAAACAAAAAERSPTPGQGSPQAYLGTTIAGFPNLFLLLGPNTGLGHNSVVYMIESQLAYVLDALRAMRERGVATSRSGPRRRRLTTPRSTAAHATARCGTTRLRELVPRRHRPQPDDLARLDLALPAPAPRRFDPENFTLAPRRARERDAVAA